MDARVIALVQEDLEHGLMQARLMIIQTGD